MEPMIPENLKQEFFGVMNVAHTLSDDLSYDEWWMALHEAAGSFLKEHKLTGEVHGAVMYFVRYHNTESRKM